MSEKTGGNEDKAEPTKLTKPNPGPNPRPPGCICTWTPLDHGWSHGRHSKCKVH